MPLARRSSVPAEASAEFFACVAPLTMKLAPGSAWNSECEHRVAHPVVLGARGFARRHRFIGCEAQIFGGREQV